MRALILAFLVLALASCRNGGAPGNAGNDPVFRRPELKDITESIQKEPQRASLYYDRGRILHRIHEDSLAIGDFKKAISLDSTKAPYYSAVGNILFDHKDVTGSVQWMQKAIALDPADPVAHMKMGKILFFMKDYPRAFAEINSVLRQDPYNPEGYFLKGMIYKDKQDTNKAISSFQTALNVAPDYRDAMIQLGQVYASKKDSLCLRYYQNAFRADTSDVFPLFAKGVFYQQTNKPEAAKEQYRECVLRDHQFVDAYFNMGYLYLAEDSIPKAFHQFDLITKVSPTEAEAYYQRGLCNEAMGKKAEAAGDYQQALVFDKTYDDAKKALSRVSK